MKAPRLCALPPCHGGQLWTPIRGQDSAPIDTLVGRQRRRRIQDASAGFRLALPDRTFLNAGTGASSVGRLAHVRGTERGIAAQGTFIRGGFGGDTRSRAASRSGRILLRSRIPRRRDGRNLRSCRRRRGWRAGDDREAQRLLTVHARTDAPERRLLIDVTIVKRPRVQGIVLTKRRLVAGEVAQFASSVP